MPTDVCLFSNSSDPIVPILRTSSAKVTEWVSRQYLMSCTFFAGLRVLVGILPEVSINLPCAIPVESYTRGVRAGRTISKRTPI